MKRHLSALTALCAAATFPALAAVAAAPEVQGPAEGRLIDRLADFKLHQLLLPPQPGDRIEVTMSLGREPVQLTLHSHSLRSPDFKVLVQVEGGALEEVPAPPVATYRGFVEGHPGSRVSGSLIDGRLTAYVHLAPEAVYVVEPAGQVGALPAAPGAHVSYRLSDLGPSGFSCGFKNDRWPHQPQPAGGGADGTGLETAELACDADVQFYIDNGSSVPATVLDIETVMNTGEFIYERDTEITYEITTIVVRTNFIDNPYTTSVPDDLLCEFRTVWNSLPESNIRRDVAQLYSGRNFAGTTIGLAYLGTLCNETGVVGGCSGSGSLAYSVVESRFTGASFSERVALSDHELGHNWNALHCSGGGCHIMCPDIGACGGISGPNLKFGTLAQSQIEAFRNSRTCLDDLPNPLSAPFLDEFPSTTVNPNHWIWYDPSLVAINDLGANEPSPPYSMRLRPFAGVEYRDGEVRSNFINLSGQSGLVVSYAAQNIGVEAGERLFVEYWSDSMMWVPLNVITSPGVDLDFYIPYEHALPSGAYHSEFRLRFRMEGDEFDDTWYVDDVYVGPPVAEPCPEDLDGDGAVGFTDLLEVLSFWGPCPGCDADIDGDGSVGLTDLLQLLSAWGPCP